MVNVKRLKRQKVEKSYRHCGSQIFNFQFSILDSRFSLYICPLSSAAKSGISPFIFLYLLNIRILNHYSLLAMVSRMIWAAWPLPKAAGVVEWLSISRWAACRMRSGLASARMAAPLSTSSTHSVSGRSTTHPRPAKQASFCRPPLSVSTSLAFCSAAKVSR